jgi:hypothetical protein
MIKKPELTRRPMKKLLDTFLLQTIEIDRAAASGVTTGKNIKKKLMAIFPYIIGLLIVVALALALLIVSLLKL